jgi:hypothetical protein
MCERGPGLTGSVSLLHPHVNAQCYCDNRQRCSHGPRVLIQPLNHGSLNSKAACGSPVAPPLEPWILGDRLFKPTGSPNDLEVQIGRGRGRGTEGAQWGGALFGSTAGVDDLPNGATTALPIATAPTDRHSPQKQSDRVRSSRRSIAESGADDLCQI